ncbi:hypothetical protein M758_UG277400 [Ceratodon purpureus]|nr:hypothetical protein M758_UG277400 [Ceratodon purpureus]
MPFIDGIPDDLVTEEILMRCRVPLDQARQIDCYEQTIVDFLMRLRRCWAISSTWKCAVERTLEWAAWRLARYEAEQFELESQGRGYSLIEIDPLHPLFGKANPFRNFKSNLIAFAKSKEVQGSAKRQQTLSSREILTPLHMLTDKELLHIRIALTRPGKLAFAGSVCQTWVTPLDRIVTTVQ